MCSDTRKTARLESGFKLTVLVNIGDLEHLFDTSEEEVCILEETSKYTWWLKIFLCLHFWFFKTCNESEFGVLCSSGSGFLSWNAGLEGFGTQISRWISFELFKKSKGSGCWLSSINWVERGRHCNLNCSLHGLKFDCCVLLSSRNCVSLSGGVVTMFE